ncbi:MAG: hypothetical protein ABSH41_28845, partial [Syntrophobacteraceae bacterium]
KRGAAQRYERLMEPGMYSLSASYPPIYQCPSVVLPPASRYRVCIVMGSISLALPPTYERMSCMAFPVHLPYTGAG